MQEFNETLELLYHFISGGDEEGVPFPFEKKELPTQQERLTRWIDVVDQ